MGGGGLGDLFTATLARVGADREPQHLLEQFPPAYRPLAAPVDLSQCQFFAMFDADPAVVNNDKSLGVRDKTAGLPGLGGRAGRSGRHGPSPKQRQFDFRLQEEEKRRLAADGFVAVQRLQADSFAEVYYRLYTDDMPVFVTADSVLHAWHRSFDACLVDIEGEMLRPLLESVLSASLAECRECLTLTSRIHTSRAILLDVELFLAVALELLQGKEAQCSPENAGSISRVRSAIKAETATTELPLFGSSRTVDLSLFTPRGHYTKSAALERYFRAVVWIGTVDLRVAGGENAESDLHQLQCAVALVHCLREAGCLDKMAKVDNIMSELRFVWSSFVFSRLVYDQVAYGGEKVPRRIPSAVDVAFALLGNNAAGEVLATRMDARKHQDGADRTGFVTHRDGLPYASNAIALRLLIDDEFATVGADGEAASISTLWLQALRSLSKPAANAASTFHSRSWHRRQMNTQIASFAQLRHDSVLYAKQSYTLGTRCEYADGMVDPYPAFWTHMQVLSTRMARIISALKAESRLAADDLCEDASNFFDDFASIMGTLAEIAVVQTEARALSESQVSFLKTVMEERFGSGASKYLGWYPRLFYSHREDSGRSDVLAVDVHTDIASIEHGDPGCVMHLGVGNVLTGFFVVNNTMYAGPLFSSYEFLTPVGERLTDEDFERQLTVFRPPEWASRSFLCESERSIEGSSPPSSLLRPRVLGTRR